MDTSILSQLATHFLAHPLAGVAILALVPPLLAAALGFLLRFSSGASAEPAERESAPTEREVVPEPETVPIAAEPERAPEPEPAVEPARLRDRLRRTSDALVGRVASLFNGRSLDADTLEELEAVLMAADLGVRTADDLLERVRRDAGEAAAVEALLREAMLEKLRSVELAPGTHLDTEAVPHVILVLGVNGAGKTTTIGKLAARHVALGRQVILGAGDTFRAAATEQLETWGERAGCDVIAGRAGGDPSAVAFDTVQAAAARGADVAIIDTAGRLQTKKPLMEELGKLVRVVKKCQEGAPHEILLVLDANTGQNALSQAKLFAEVAPLTGLILTKLDGTAKGGVIVGLADELGVPVKHVGVGEAVEDLRDFSAEEFVDALFG
ncbi:MAG: signal recognition particle-docking protein FtsY [Deltaproteobacteria bacterium]|nr:signal recognition particle-docking protein FtsY [Deltaproteobacteria bacterium]MBW2361481.1 signal recognition particle-docking protein FtsY [Deltaproteobacteria bacterium]